MWSLKREIESRKENLVFLLKNKRDELDLEKQHQIYGAIKELVHIERLVEEKLSKHKMPEEQSVSEPAQMQTEESVSGEQIAQTQQVNQTVEKKKRLLPKFSIKFANK
jgi:hypothetical protein